MVKNKLIAARMEKGFSQERMADLLFMDQSQYSRREKGITKITEDEWEKMATILEKQIEDIFEEETQVTINNDNGSQGSITYSGTINFYNIPDFLLQSQQKYIESLEQENKNLREILNKTKETK